LTGLIDSITTAVANIDSGRKGFATRGKEHEGRIAYELGIDQAMSSFQEAKASSDSHAIILAEYTFIVQERSLCDISDTDSFNSLTKAVGSFDDAFRTLKTVDNKTLYQGAETTYPHDKEHREKNGFPKDAFHLAFNSHKTRLQNILRTPGLDPIEKNLLRQRVANLPVAQKSYREKQKKALEST
jgi:hypothetical protein